MDPCNSVGVSMGFAMALRLLVALIVLLLSSQAHATCGSRGFGSTFGAGATDNIQGTYTAAPGLTGTYATWLWINGIGGGSNGRVLDQGGSHVQIDTPSGLITFVFSFSTTAGSWTVPAPSSSAWHHYAVVYDVTSSSNTPSIYVDGIA
jgi:hypothetical protein